MKRPLRFFLLSAALCASLQIQVYAAQAEPPKSAERLGVVDFRVSCATQVRAAFNRGVALLHDFWYDEAGRQFREILKADPHCSVAHWALALSSYHQIWNRPDDSTLKEGWEEMQKAAAPPAATARERGYIAALSSFFKPEQKDYQTRVDAYSAAMADLYRHYPDDVDAGAFYALSLLAAEKPHDTSLSAERAALAVLNPLFARYPDHPGVVHYIIHACDNPPLASQGLAAANHYGEIAPSGAHAVHMPGHIFARLGMWPEDIRVNLASVEACRAAESRGQSDGMDQFHSEDFLIYAYLQGGDEARAKRIMDDSVVAMQRYEAMPDMTSSFMRYMFPYYRNKFPAFYDLETRDWRSAAALEPSKDGGPENALVTYWARVVASGHLHDAAAARASFERHEALVADVKRGEYAYLAHSTSAQISHDELVAWVAFAEGRDTDALREMRAAAELQDKVGQGEVDIPAREMLADMLLELHHPQDALAEYDRALELSPNRFNGLFGAGRAAEAAGHRDKAASFYSALLKSTDQGTHSMRPEIAHARSAVAAEHVASN